MITLATNAQTVTLKNPDLGDTDQLNIKTKFKMSMTSLVYSYLNTPTMTKFLLNFSHVPTASVTALLVVLKDGAGKSFTYTDYNDVAWTVKVMNNPFERSADGRAPCISPSSMNENHSFVLELEVIP